MNSQRPKPATFGFKNIGPVKDAEVEIGDLTIIAGRNNTGKTYIVYTLYGFLKMLQGRNRGDYFLENAMNHNTDFADIRWIIEEVSKEGRASISLDREKIRQQQQLVIQQLARVYSKDALRLTFSTRHSDFKDSSIEVALNETEPSNYFNVIGELHGGVQFSIDYDGSNFSVAVDATKDQRQILDFESEIARHYFSLLLCNLFPDPLILSAERFGISLFYKELDFTKNQLVDLLQKMGDAKSRDWISPFLLIDKTTSRYALPIKDNIDYTRDIPNLQESKSEVFESKLFDDIKDMMDGYYGNSGDDIRFISKARGKGRSFNIPLHLASSSARGLSDFYFFLRHAAMKNHLLIVDEPESHLDTSNQILLARLLARCVRAGLKVLITTHSDYLIKEINNLVMLSRPFENKEAVVKKFKYSHEDFLDPDSIRAYVAQDNSLTRCEVDKFGIDMPVFDETIDRINRVANDLASRMSDESEA